MTSCDYQLFVIVGGSGGVRSALPPGLGKHVAIAEDFADAPGFGWTVAPAEFSWSKLIVAKNKEITRLSGPYKNNLVASNSAVMHGAAQLVDAHTVVVNGQQLTA